MLKIILHCEDSLAVRSFFKRSLRLTCIVLFHLCAGWRFLKRTPKKDNIAAAHFLVRYCRTVACLHHEFISTHEYASPREGWIDTHDIIYTCLGGIYKFALGTFGCQESRHDIAFWNPPSICLLVLYHIWHLLPGRQSTLQTLNP